MTVHLTVSLPDDDKPFSDISGGFRKGRKLDLWFNTFSLRGTAMKRLRMPGMVWAMCVGIVLGMQSCSAHSV